MFTNIEKELTKDKNQVVKKQEEAVEIMKFLEAGEALEDARIMRALGTNTNFQRAELSRGNKIELENLEEKFKGKVFTKQVIKELAIKYNLRFLQSKHYCGNLDVEIFAKIKTFNRETGVEINDESLQRSYYILAPEECFNLKKVAKLKHDPDPAIFYQIDEDKYRFIHQWGNDFSIARRIKSLWYASPTSKYFMLSLILMLFISAIVGPIVHFNTLKEYWGLLLLPLISFGISWIVVLLPISDNIHSSEYERYILKYSPHKWNSDKKLDNTLPTEYYR